MWNNKTPEQIYLESNPEASLKEWLDYKSQEAKRKAEMENERLKIVTNG